MTGPDPENEDRAAARRESGRLFPVPDTPGQVAWTVLSVLYVGLVVACTVYEMLWLLDFDPDGGAPIAFLTMLVTAPLGWVGLIVGGAISRSLGLGNDADTVLVWTAMGVFGVLQGWFVWRMGIGWVRAARHRAADRPVSAD